MGSAEKTQTSFNPSLKHREGRHVNTQTIREPLLFLFSDQIRLRTTTFGHGAALDTSPIDWPISRTNTLRA